MNIQPLTLKQQKMAEENHDLVYSFLNKNDLPESIFYDVVIFGYLKAVQEYCNNRNLHNYRFSTIAWKKMRSSLYNHYRYMNRAKRNAPIVSLNEPVDSDNGLCQEDIVCCQDSLMKDFETELMLHALADVLPTREMRIIRMKMYGCRMHDIAKAEHMTFHDINKLIDNTYQTVIKVVIG